MKKLVYIPLIALSLTACQAATDSPSLVQDTAVLTATEMAATTARKATATPVKAVRIYADWCSKCKALDAKLEGLKTEHDFTNVEFIYLDYTAKDPDIFYAQARELGIEGQVKAVMGERVRTGQMFIFDAQSGEKLHAITHDMAEADISAALLN